jgi:hypothetical protein
VRLDTRLGAEVTSPPTAAAATLPAADASPASTLARLPSAPKAPTDCDPARLPASEGRRTATRLLVSGRAAALAPLPATASALLARISFFWARRLASSAANTASISALKGSAVPSSSSNSSTRCRMLERRTAMERASGPVMLRRAGRPS